jgi:hypothetical protein
MQRRPYLPLRADAVGARPSLSGVEGALRPFSEADEHLFVDIERAIAWPRSVSRLQQESNIVAAPQPFQAAGVGCSAGVELAAALVRGHRPALWYGRRH